MKATDIILAGVFAGGGSGGGGGGESGIFIVKEEGSGPYTLDKTFREITNAMASGKLAVVMWKNPEDEFGREARLVTATYYLDDDQQYFVDAGSYTYSCEAPDDYPFAEG